MVFEVEEKSSYSPKKNDCASCLKMFCCGKKSSSSSTTPDQNGKQDIIRLLMVGNGEVGKSTIIKQMKNLAYTNGTKYTMFDEEWKKELRPFTEIERRSQTLLIHQNILRIIGTLIDKVHEYRYDFDSYANRKHAEELMAVIDNVDTIHQQNIQLNPHLAELITLLWGDSGIQRAYEKRCGYLLSDSTQYFLDRQKLAVISAPDYIPTADDILRARDPTTGINDYNFKIDGNRFSIRDLGGQPVERQRLASVIDDWLTECESTGSRRNFILYVASLADYNQSLLEHPDHSKLDESIKLLTLLMGIKQLRDTGFILFLNKSDIFHEKIVQFQDLQEYFKEYIPSKFQRYSVRTDIVKYRAMADECVAKKFHEAILGTIRRDDALYCRFTCATDREHMKTIFNAVRMDILTDLIKHGNML